MSKPTKREYQWDKPYCILERDDCLDCFENVDVNYKGCARCDKCRIAIDKKNSTHTSKSKDVFTELWDNKEDDRWDKDETQKEAGDK